MISVLVPWRSTDEHRIRAWHYNRLRWQGLDVQLCVSSDGRTEGPFSVARALNRARQQAAGDVLAMFGADHIPPAPEKLAWIAARLEASPWTAVYAGTLVLGENDTARVLGGATPELYAETRAHRIGMCEGILAMRADVWDDVGGEDERFEGWGSEDTAFRVALAALYPNGRPDGEGDVIALWHAEAPRDQTPANIARCDEYMAAASAGRMRDYLREVR